MILMSNCFFTDGASIPRESGDDPNELRTIQNMFVYSPRERG